MFRGALVKKQCTFAAKAFLQSSCFGRSLTKAGCGTVTVNMIPGAVNETFYKRTLPCPPAIEFSSPHGIALFQEAFGNGTMLGFFKLVEQYRTQTEPAFCGLTSLAMVLNALSIDPKRTWKAPWRWFDETLLDCCKPLSLVKKEGLNLLQATCLARCNGAEVTMKHSGSFSLDEFRELVKACCMSGEKHLIAHYSRRTMSQTGDGHFSPVGGYHIGQDMVLILDTARFKYPPHWVPLELLFKAMGEVDLNNGKARGYIVMRAPDRPISLCYTLNRSQESWTRAEQYIYADAPKLFRELASTGASLEAILRELVDRCPLESVQKFVAVRFSGCSCVTDASITDPIHSTQEVQKHLEKTGISAGPLDEHQVGRVTALLLLRTPDQWLETDRHPEIRQKLDELMDLSTYSLVKTEVDFLRHQMDILVTSGELQASRNNTDRAMSTWSIG